MKKFTIEFRLPFRADTCQQTVLAQSEDGAVSVVRDRYNGQVDIVSVSCEETASSLLHAAYKAKQKEADAEQDVSLKLRLNVQASKIWKLYTEA